MKKRGFFVASLVASLLFAGCSNEEAKPATTDSSSPSAASSENVVNIEASNWKFNQDRYEVKAGTPFTVHFTSKEGVHGLTIDGLDVNIQQTGDQTLTVDKPGEYKMICSIPCGPDHGSMSATLVVK